MSAVVEELRERLDAEVGRVGGLAQGVDLLLCEGVVPLAIDLRAERQGAEQRQSEREQAPRSSVREKRAGRYRRCGTSVPEDFGEHLGVDGVEVLDGGVEVVGAVIGGNAHHIGQAPRGVVQQHFGVLQMARTGVEGGMNFVGEGVEAADGLRGFHAVALGELASGELGEAVGDADVQEALIGNARRGGFRLKLSEGGGIERIRGGAGSMSGRAHGEAEGKRKQQGETTSGRADIHSAPRMEQLRRIAETPFDWRAALRECGSVHVLKGDQTVTRFKRLVRICAVFAGKCKKSAVVITGLSVLVQRVMRRCTQEQGSW